MRLLNGLILSMALAASANAATYERPIGAYTPSTFTENATKYQDDSQAVPRRAISSAKMDGDINKAFDGLNQLDERLGTIEASGGVTPGDKGALTVSGTSWTLNSGVVSRSTLAADISSSLVPTGSVMFFAGATAPSGWVLGYGQSVSRSGVYAPLFGVTGTAHGTSDSESFNIIDCRGRVLAGRDDMGGVGANRLTSSTSGISATTLGAAGGDQRMQQHNHGITDPGHSHTAGPGTNQLAAPGSGFDWNFAGGGVFKTTSTNTTDITINNAGAGNSQNVQPTIVLNCMVKL